MNCETHSSTTVIAHHNIIAVPIIMFNVKYILKMYLQFKHKSLEAGPVRFPKTHLYLNVPVATNGGRIICKTEPILYLVHSRVSKGALKNKKNDVDGIANDGAPHKISQACNPPAVTAVDFLTCTFDGLQW